MSFTAGLNWHGASPESRGAPYSYDTDEEQKVQDTHSTE